MSEFIGCCCCVCCLLPIFIFVFTARWLPTITVWEPPKTFNGTLRFEESVLTSFLNSDYLILNVKSSYSTLPPDEDVRFFFHGTLLFMVKNNVDNGIMVITFPNETSSWPVVHANDPAGVTSFNFQMKIPHCLVDKKGGFVLSMKHKRAMLDTRKIYIGGTSLKSILIHDEKMDCGTDYYTTERTLRVGCVIEDYPNKPTVKFESSEGQIEIGHASTTNITRGGNRCLYTGNSAEHTVNLGTNFTSMSVICKVNDEECHVRVYNTDFPCRGVSDCFTYYVKGLLIGAIAFMVVCLLFWYCYKKCYPKRKTASLSDVIRSTYSTASSAIYHVIDTVYERLTGSESNNPEWYTSLSVVEPSPVLVPPSRSDEDDYVLPSDHPEPDGEVSGIQPIQNTQLNDVVRESTTYTHSRYLLLRETQSNRPGLTGDVCDSISRDSKGYYREDYDDLDSNGYYEEHRESFNRDSYGYEV